MLESSDTILTLHTQMPGTIRIDSIGHSVLTITDDHAVHSVPLTSQTLRISGPDGEIQYKLNQLPVTYDVGSLQGRLNILDSKDRLVYCWRSLDQYRSSRRSPAPQGQRNTRSRSPRRERSAQNRGLAPGLKHGLPSNQSSNELRISPQSKALSASKCFRWVTFSFGICSQFHSFTATIWASTQSS